MCAETLREVKGKSLTTGSGFDTQTFGCWQLKLTKGAPNDDLQFKEAGLGGTG